MLRFAWVKNVCGQGWEREEKREKRERESLAG